MDETPVGIERVGSDVNNRSWPKRPVVEIVLCVAGCLVAAYFPAIGCALMVAGVWLLGRAEEGKKVWGVAACLVPLALLSVVSWVNLGSYALPSVVCALMVALVLPGHITVTTVVLCIVATACIIAGADESVLLALGSNLPEYVQSVFESIAGQTSVLTNGSGSSVMMAAASDQAMDVLKKVWPLMYAGQAAVVVLFGLVGLACARRMPYRRLYHSFLHYDVPIWGIGALIGACVCLLVSGTDVAQASVFESIGLCVLLFMRVVYFLQGLAVGMALMEQHRIGQVARIVVVALMLVCELSFYALSVFGVIDGLANFRRLPRHEKTIEAQ